MFANQGASASPAGTPIAVKGGFKNIEHIEVGDEVWSWNVEKGEIGLKSVVNTIESEADALVELGFGMERFKTTPEHPFWVGDSKNGAWKDAGDLVEGDQLWLLDKRNVSLSVVDHQPQPENKVKVYNFEVRDWHTYFVGWWMVLVHNNEDPCKEAAEQAAKKIDELGEAIKKEKEIAEETSKSFNKISDNYLKEAGIDAHQLKKDFLGSKAKISHYDLYKDTKTGEILIFLKGGKGTPIPTGEFIK